MTVLLVLALLILIAVAIRLAAPALARLRLRAQLRGDWWSRFEGEFHAYADAKAWRTARDAERRAG